MNYKSKRGLKLSSIDLLERRVVYLDGEMMMSVQEILLRNY